MTPVIGGSRGPRHTRLMTPPYALPAFDFDRAPFLVIWETTRACALACIHCRADAIPCRDPRELTTDEAFRLVDQVRAFAEPASKPPLFVLTGGDPCAVPISPGSCRYAADAGLTVALTPSGTAAATRKRLAELKDAGLSRVAVSLDGPDADAHDAFRRVKGSYMWTMRIIDAAIELGLPLQINSTMSRSRSRTSRRWRRRSARCRWRCGRCSSWSRPAAAPRSIRSRPRSASGC